MVLLQDGATALQFASQEGHTHVVEQLLGDPGIDVNAVSEVSAL
jgi:ankyrin repeat protein